MGKTKEQIVDEYLDEVAEIYHREGRYGHCLKGEELKQRFVADNPEYAEAIQVSFNVVKKQLDSSFKVRWPDREQIKGLAKEIIDELNSSPQAV